MELKLKGLNIDPELYKGWTFDQYKEAYEMTDNYKIIPEPQRTEVMKEDWSEIEKHLPKKAEKKEKKEE